MTCSQQHAVLRTLGGYHCLRMVPRLSSDRSLRHFSHLRLLQKSKSVKSEPKTGTSRWNFFQSCGSNEYQKSWANVSRKPAQLRLGVYICAF